MENIGVKMIISLIRPIIIFSLTAIFAIASISCSTEGVTLEEFATLSTELAATKNQVQEFKIQLADAEFKVSQYENTLREYTTIVDADYDPIAINIRQYIENTFVLRPYNPAPTMNIEQCWFFPLSIVSPPRRFANEFIWKINV